MPAKSRGGVVHVGDWRIVFVQDYDEEHAGIAALEKTGAHLAVHQKAGGRVAFIPGPDLRSFEYDETMRNLVAELTKAETAQDARWKTLEHGIIVNRGKRTALTGKRIHAILETVLADSSPASNGNSATIGEILAKKNNGEEKGHQRTRRRRGAAQQRQSGADRVRELAGFPA